MRLAPMVDLKLARVGFLARLSDIVRHPVYALIDADRAWARFAKAHPWRARACYFGTLLFFFALYYWATISRDSTLYLARGLV